MALKKKPDVKKEAPGEEKNDLNNLLVKKKCTIWTEVCFQRIGLD